MNSSNSQIRGAATGSASAAADISETSQSADDFLKSTFDQEYEAQFLGFTPKAFSDGLYNAVMDYMSDYLEPIVSRINQECRLGLSEEQKGQILTKLHGSVGPSIDKAFDKMEVFVAQNILRIPAHVLLAEDKIHGLHSASNTDVERLATEIEELKKRIAAKKYVNACLRAELEESAPVLSDLDLLLQTQKLAQRTLEQEAPSEFKCVMESAAAEIQRLQQQQIEEPLNGSAKECQKEDEEEK